MKVIFLDIDGVLNHYQIAKIVGFGGWFTEDDVMSRELVKWDPECVSRLQELAQRTGAKIVISSTWRHHFSVGKFVEMFAVYGWKDAPVIGVTPRHLAQQPVLSAPNYASRGAAIQEWLDTQTEKIDAYVIIDDYPDMLESQRPFFIQTSMKDGFTQAHAVRALHVLEWGPADIKYVITDIYTGNPEEGREKYIYAQLRRADTYETVISASLDYIAKAVAERCYTVVPTEKHPRPGF
jgi:hypothetical protein